MVGKYAHTNTHPLFIYIYIYIRGAFNMFPDFLYKHLKLS